LTKNYFNEKGEKSRFSDEKEAFFTEQFFVIIFCQKIVHTNFRQLILTKTYVNKKKTKNCFNHIRYRREHRKKNCLQSLTVHINAVFDLNSPTYLLLTCSYKRMI
jgi:hypothetical protein